MTQVSFRRPSLPRYRALFFQGRLSVLRILLYERMAHVGLTGSVLDFGGGDGVGYAGEVARWSATGAAVDFQSANIDPAARPTYPLRIGEPLPIADETFDAVFSLSTLEHVYELDDTLEELHRVLKPDGRLILSIPFLFRVHGHPDDYHRGTPSFWHRKLSQTGFKRPDVEVLGWGPISTGDAVSGLPGPFKSARRHIGLLLDILWFTLRVEAGTNIVGKQDDSSLAAPLGYFIETRKAATEGLG